MKLSTNKQFSNEPVKLELKQPDGTSHEPQVFITLYPVDSKIGKAAQTEGFRELLAMRERDESIVNDEDVIVNGMLIEKKGEPKADIIVDMSAKALARLIVEWEGIEDEDGNTIPYDYETATALFKSNEDFFMAVNVLAGQTGKFYKSQSNDLATTQSKSDSTTPHQTKTTKRATKKADSN